jgi:hypothetical protein
MERMFPFALLGFMYLQEASFRFRGGKDTCIKVTEAIRYPDLVAFSHPQYPDTMMGFFARQKKRSGTEFP